MTMIFDHNNNSEECQMFFDKINNGSPFRVITFIGPVMIKNITIVLFLNLNMI